MHVADHRNVCQDLSRPYATHVVSVQLLFKKSPLWEHFVPASGTQQAWERCGIPLGRGFLSAKRLQHLQSDRRHDVSAAIARKNLRDMYIRLPAT